MIKPCKFGHTSGRNTVGACLECNRLKAARYLSKHPERTKQAQIRYRKNNPDASKAAYLKCKYGITLQDKQEMFALGDGRCWNKSCLRLFESLSDAQVDHNHETGKIRGLLCKSCNVALGLLQDDPNVISGLADYHAKYD